MELYNTVVRNGKLELATRRGPKNKLTVTREELASKRQQMSVGVMAKYYGVSKSTIYKYLREAGLVNGK